MLTRKPSTSQAISFLVILMLPVIFMISPSSQEIAGTVAEKETAQALFEPVKEWIAIYDFLGTGADDQAQAIAVDDSGNIYVTGCSAGNGTSTDIATIKYDKHGRQIWVRRYNGSANLNDCGYAIAVAKSGYVYVSGRSQSTNYDYVTVKYDNDGNEIWAKRFSAVPDWGPMAIVVDDLNNAYVSGAGGVVKYDSDSNQLWSDTSFNAYTMIIGPDGNIYVVGDLSSDFMTVKYAPSGAKVWSRTYDGTLHAGDHARSVAVDKSYNVYVTGVTNGDAQGEGYATVKYDSSGTQVWVKKYDGPAYYQHDRPVGVAVDDQSNVYVSGWSDQGEGRSLDYLTIKYDTNGNQLWLQRYDHNGSWDQAFKMAIDKLGNVYVTGFSNGDYATVMYDTNGNEIWANRYNYATPPDVSYSYPNTMAVDSDGNVYVTGGAAKTGYYDYDYLTIKYSTRTPKLVGYWKFDEGTGTVAHDSSGYGNDAALINGAAWADGKFGKALNLDGINDYAQVPDASSLDLDVPFTIMTWIYPRSFSGGYTSFINKYFNYILQTDGEGFNRLRCAFDIYPGGAHAAESANYMLKPYSWQHVAAVWDGNTIRVYVNGVEVGSNYEGNIIPQITSTPLQFGVENTYYQAFNGLMDEIKIFRGALTQQEIANEASGLMLNMKFDEGSGTTASDSSGHNNNGTFVGGASWADGKIGKALDLDGTSSYVQVPNSESLKISGPYTLLAWIYPRNWGTFYKSFINKYYNYMFQTGENVSDKGRLRITFTGHFLESGADTLALNTWQHVAAVWDGNYFYLYKNGSVVASSNEGPATPQVEDNPLYIGAEWGSWEFFDGLIDEVKIYRRALSTSDIRTDCGAFCAPPPKPWSCPYLHVWDGKDFVLDNDILPAGSPKIYTDHYKLMKPLVAKDDKYNLKIVDSEDETSWLDYIKLLQIDHPKETSIAPTPSGEIMTYKEPLKPISALDHKKTDQLSKVVAAEGTEKDSYYGEKGDSLTVDFGEVKDKSNGARLILHTDLKCPPGKNDIPVADTNSISQVQSLHVYVWTGTKKWQKIGIVHPHQRWDEWVVPVPEGILKKVSGEFKVKIEWTQPHRLDYVGLDISKPEAIVITELPLLKAVHSTKGDVRSLVSKSDNKNAVTVMDELIDLEFPALSLPTGQRSFVFVSQGKYKANKK